MPRMLTTRKLEESVDERCDCRAFGKHQQHADSDERDHDGSEPELLVLAHELPQLGNDVKLRHSNFSIHLLVMPRIFLPLRIRLPERVTRSCPALQWIPA